MKYVLVVAYLVPGINYPVTVPGTSTGYNEGNGTRYPRLGPTRYSTRYVGNCPLCIPITPKECITVPVNIISLWNKTKEGISTVRRHISSSGLILNAPTTHLQLYPSDDGSAKKAAPDKLGKGNGSRTD